MVFAFAVALWLVLKGGDLFCNGVFYERNVHSAMDATLDILLIVKPLTLSFVPHLLYIGAEEVLRVLDGSHSLQGVPAHQAQYPEAQAHLPPLQEEIVASRF